MYLDKLEAAKNGGDVFGGVGSNVDIGEGFVKSGSDTKILSSTDGDFDSVDLSWLDSISN